MIPALRYERVMSDDFVNYVRTTAEPEIFIPSAKLCFNAKGYVYASAEGNMEIYPPLSEQDKYFELDLPIPKIVLPTTAINLDQNLVEKIRAYVGGKWSDGSEDFREEVHKVLN
jgi:hypothetical protein